VILTGEEKDIHKILVECECGTEAIMLSRYDWNDGTRGYYLEFILNAFYTEQEGFFSKLKNRMKLILFILIKGQHRFMELDLTKENVEELKIALEKF